MSLPPWLSPPRFEQEDQTRLAQHLATFLWGLGLLELMVGLLTPWLSPQAPGTSLLFVGFALAYTLGCYWLMLKRRLALAGFLICVFLWGATLGIALTRNGSESLMISLYTLVIILAGLLLGSRASFFFSILGVVSLISIYFLETTGLRTMPAPAFLVLQKMAVSAVVFILSGLLFHHLTQNKNHALQTGQQREAALEKAYSELKASQTILEQRLESRTTQLHASMTIGQTISHLLPPDELGQQFIQKFSTLFAYDFAGLYLLDETGRWANLKYSHPETALFGQGETPRFDLTQSNAITYALRSQKAYVSTDFSKASEFYTPLKSTGLRTEITLPLHTRGKLVGVLNLQAYQPIHLTSQEIENLLNIANQIASALENTRLFYDTQKQLEESSRLNKFYLQTTWRALLTEETPAYQFSTGEINEIPQPDETVLETAQQTRKIQLSQEDEQSKLIAPIMFQDQVLGALQLSAPNRVWTAEEKTLIETVLNQTALSLENTRLIVETRSRAEQEKMIGEISNRMRETLDLETILQTTAQNIQKAFNLAEVEVRLFPAEKRDTSELYISIPGE